MQGSPSAMRRDVEMGRKTEVSGAGEAFLASPLRPPFRILDETGQCR